MAETTNTEESVFDAKRKVDTCSEEKQERSNKIQKLEVVEGDSCNAVKNGVSGGGIDGDSLVEGGKDGGVCVDVGEAEDEDYEEVDSDEDEEEDGSDDGGKLSGKVDEDRKGKGIMKDDKGKGKFIEEEEDDDDDDDDDGSELGSEESDLSDDPLTEVDLDNILPSRTRRRTVHPGVYFATDLGNDNDDSSDSDA